MDNAEEALPDLKAERRVRKALAKLVRDIQKEPRLIFEIGDRTEVDSVDGILCWLFMRRDRDDNACN